jgi:hypothetical protein
MVSIEIFPNGVTGKKCTAFFTARGASSPYWIGLGENLERR